MLKFKFYMGNVMQSLATYFRSSCVPAKLLSLVIQSPTKDTCTAGMKVFLGWCLGTEAEILIAKEKNVPGN